MKRREIKKRVLDLLERGSWDNVVEGLKSFTHQELVHHLFTSLCSTSEICKWHGISAFGVVVPALCREDTESARVIMRRFLWCLNDESGGIGWGVPEAMGEVMANDITLFEEYSHMLISYMRHDGPELLQDGNYLELPALQQGLLWSVGRLLQERNEAMVKKKVGTDIRQYLGSPDKTVQGLAARCLTRCYDHESVEALQRLSASTHSFNLFEEYTLKNVTTGELARQALVFQHHG